MLFSHKRVHRLRLPKLVNAAGPPTRNGTCTTAATARTGARCTRSNHHCGQTPTSRPVMQVYGARWPESGWVCSTTVVRPTVTTLTSTPPSRHASGCGRLDT